MRLRFLFAALALLPSSAFADGNQSVVVQDGENNLQVTQQQGRNFAAKVQIGDDNVATSNQTGDLNVSVVGQFGEGLTKNHSQSGGPGAQSSVQVSTDLAPSSGSATHSNGWFSLTADYEAY